MIDTHAIYAILISAVCNYGLRGLPFVLFSGERKMPQWLMRLGVLLPSAIMAVLIVYAVKDGVGNIMGALVPKLSGILVVGLTYKWKHNTIASIIAGTAVYMILIRVL